MVKHTLSRLLVLLSLAGLSACPRQLALPANPAVANQKFLDYETARDGWLLARSQVKAEAPDALPVRIEGRWIDVGGRSLGWSFEFYSPSRHQLLLVEDGELQLVQPAQEGQETLDSERWRFDSDAAVAQLALTRQLSFPLSSMTLGADLIWHINGPAGNWQLDAVQGIPLF